MRRFTPKIGYPKIGYPKNWLPQKKWLPKKLIKQKKWLPQFFWRTLLRGGLLLHLGKMAYFILYGFINAIRTLNRWLGHRKRHEETLKNQIIQNWMKIGIQF